MYLNKRTSHRGSATVLALIFAASATPVLADYPGEVWSVDAVEIKAASAPQTSGSAMTPSQIRRGIQQASDIYFFGDRPARLRAELLPGTAPAVRLSLIERAGGTTVARSSALRLSDRSDAVQTAALAWMEGLTCASAGCAVLPEADQPVRVAKARLAAEYDAAKTQPRSASIGTETVASVIPVPKSRPTDTHGRAKLEDVRPQGAKRSGKDLVTAASSLQIAWAIPRETGALTYGEADRLVLDAVGDSSGALSTAAPKPVPAVRKTAPADEPDTFFGRMFSGFARLFGFEAEENAEHSAPVVGAAEETAKIDNAERVAPSQADAEVATATPWLGTSNTVPLINPVDRFSPLQQEPQGSAEVQLAAVAPDLMPLKPASAATRSATNDLSDPDPVLSARKARAEQQKTRPRLSTSTPLKVRLHPELLGRYAFANASANALLGQTRAASLRSARKRQSDVIRSSELGKTLSNRGLALDVATYSRFERVYWSGYGEEGYWISLPNRVGSEFVLISGPRSSVIAAVLRRDGIARVSPGVAEAIGLQSRQWANLRVVALRGAEDLTAQVPARSRAALRKGRNRLR